MTNRTFHCLTLKTVYGHRCGGRLSICPPLTYHRNRVSLPRTINIASYGLYEHFPQFTVFSYCDGEEKYSAQISTPTMGQKGKMHLAALRTQQLIDLILKISFFFCRTESAEKTGSQCFERKHFRHQCAKAATYRPRLKLVPVTQLTHTIHIVFPLSDFHNNIFSFSNGEGHSNTRKTRFEI